MKTILVCNQKGGCGKSTLVDEICWGFDRDQIKYNLYDMDKQNSLTHEPHETDDAVVNIIDTPGALQKDLVSWIEKADLIIVPTLMARKDKAPLELMVQILKPYKKKKKILYVLNRWDRTNRTKNFILWFDARYPDLNSAILSQSTKISDADDLDESVIDLSPRCSASEQIKTIYAYVKTELNLREGWR